MKLTAEETEAKTEIEIERVLTLRSASILGTEGAHWAMLGQCLEAFQWRGLLT